MKKKSFAVAFSILLTLALVIAMMPITASAASLSSKLESALEFCVDFSTGSDEDTQGNYERVEDASDETYYEDDAELGKQVAIFGDESDCYVVTYENVGGEFLSGYDLYDGITLEAFVYLTTEDMVNMTFVEAAGGCLHLQQYNDGADASIGFRCGDTPAEGEGGDGGDAGYSMRNAYADEILEPGRWIHLVGVSDGETNKFYIDGEEKVSVDRNQNFLTGVNGNEDVRITVGESIFGSLFGDTAVQGKIAFVKMYKAAADAEDIAAMFANATEGLDPNATPGEKTTPEPTEEPTPEPTEEPTAAPTAEPTPEPTPEPSGISGGLIGIIIGCVVVVAAAVVALIVVLKKKGAQTAETENKDEKKSEEE